ncbi:MAG: MBL fold metallo-hydrolase [Chloroflexi bacterium]|nr:MBL fold metallo-hydrolase [Chloroflexota bacterium]
MEIAPGIRVIQVPEEHVMRPVFTDIYLVGDGELLMIDTGEEADRFSQAMFSALVELGPSCKVAQVCVTHSHMDHCGGLRWARETLGATIRAHPAVIPKVEKKVGKDKIQPLKDGEVLKVGGKRIEVHFTPGHSEDSVCYFIRRERILFTGDTILGVGTTTVNDLYDYMATMEQLLKLKPRMILPGHGPVIPDASRTIQEYIAHRNMRERQISQQLQRAPRTAHGLVRAIYADVDKRLHRAARGNVRQHLKKLEKEGLVRVEGAGARAKYYWAG